ncbi:Ultraviolet-B receptor UVR8 [Heracleum sosnowskyi]|uniref:Ultraviolet-B receptor UVR8 n=1 Tax=Heracleum sosnowskyi TaxID=360622 RepID=A0AAD8H6I0_9APIA|nr:Ultraviolet-B receptor UVR8 [Heracleum sosnowskyi]
METTIEQEEEKKQEVWSWGAGTDGQLATGRLQDELVPQLLPSSLFQQPISSLSCGGAHVIALLHGGKVLTWGRGTSGQLGHGDLLSCSFPKPVEFFQDFVVTCVSAGWNHSGFVSDEGCLFTCGDGSFGQLGNGELTSQCTPLIVSNFASRHVDKIACGMRHSLALLKGRSGDQVYGFGSAKRGQLGVPYDIARYMSTPQCTRGLEDINIVCISANGDHTAALSTDGDMYIWGRGFTGSSDICYPQSAISSTSLCQMALGWHHALVLTGNGDVFMFGGARHGVLGDLQTSMLKNATQNAEETNINVMERVPGLDGVKILQVAAGAEHSAIVKDDGTIMTWGWGEHGQLGLGSTCDQTMPQFVSLNQRDSGSYTKTTTKAYCGSGFTFAIRT